MFSPYFKKFLPGPQFWNLSFLYKYVQKMLSWIWKIYLTSHPSKIDSEYSLLTFFSQPSFLLRWLLGLHNPLLLLHTDFLLRFQIWYMWHIILSVIRKSILHRLKYRDFGSIISLKYDQIGDPKTPFSNFLKYGENKKSHVFTIDNTNALKKRSQFSYPRIVSRRHQ